MTAYSVGISAATEFKQMQFAELAENIANYHVNNFPKEQFTYLDFTCGKPYDAADNRYNAAFYMNVILSAYSIKSTLLLNDWNNKNVQSLKEWYKNYQNVTVCREKFQKLADHVETKTQRGLLYIDTNGGSPFYESVVDMINHESFINHDALFNINFLEMKRLEALHHYTDCPCYENLFDAIDAINKKYWYVNDSITESHTCNWRDKARHWTLVYGTNSDITLNSNFVPLKEKLSTLLWYSLTKKQRKKYNISDTIESTQLQEFYKRSGYTVGVL